MVNFHESSQNIWLEDGHILHAECGNGEDEYVESTLDLDYYIGNNDGSFQWGGESKSTTTRVLQLHTLTATRLLRLCFRHLLPTRGRRQCPCSPCPPEPL